MEKTTASQQAPFAIRGTKKLLGPSDPRGIIVEIEVQVCNNVDDDPVARRPWAP